MSLKKIAQVLKFANQADYIDESKDFDYLNHLIKDEEVLVGMEYEHNGTVFTYMVTVWSRLNKNEGTGGEFWTTRDPYDVRVEPIAAHQNDVEVPFTEIDRQYLEQLIKLEL